MASLRPAPILTASLPSTLGRPACSSRWVHDISWMMMKEVFLLFDTGIVSYLSSDCLALFR